jgi:pseudouridine-5'-phosphate glycosidase
VFADRLAIDPRVAAALRDRRPVVALESTLISHGLPFPQNLEVARAAEAAVVAAGATPATIAIRAGRVLVGLGPNDLEALAKAPAGSVVKAARPNLAAALSAEGWAATTVSATMIAAAAAGIDVFATGGIGGVHRGGSTTLDISSDLDELARTPVAVICAGPKSILDVAATLERLETLNVTVMGYRTDAFPGFYLADSGHPVGWRAESPADVAAVMRARAELGLAGRAIVVANPLPAGEQLDPALHDRVLAEGLEAVAAGGVSGRDVTPFLLDRFHRETAGASLDVNIRLVLRNARLAGDIAIAATGA